MTLPVSGSKEKVFPGKKLRGIKREKFFPSDLERLGQGAPAGP